MEISCYHNNSFVVDNIIKESTIKVDALQSKFIHTFFAYVSADNLKELSAEEYVTLALQAFKNFKHNKSGVNINVFNHPHAHNKIVIETHLTDMPFLVDSFENALINLGLQIIQIIHPVINAKRNHAGEVVDLYLKDEHNSKAEFHAESLIHFYVTDHSGKITFEQIKAHLNIIAQNVTNAVADWQLMTNKAYQISTEKFLDQEQVEFIHWLIDHNFTFLGAVEFDKGEIVKNSSMGIGKLNDQQLIMALKDDYNAISNHADNIIITKINYISPVHRNTNLEVMTVRLSEHAQIKFFGLFTTLVYYQSARVIPIIRKKIETVINRSGFHSASYNRKELASLLESYPRDELFQIGEQNLFECSLSLLSLKELPKIKLFLQSSNANNFMSCIVVVPKQQFSDQLCAQIRSLLCNKLKGNFDRDYVNVHDIKLVKYHVNLSHVPNKTSTDLIEDIEGEIHKLASSWTEGLIAGIEKHKLYPNPEFMVSKYKSLFNNSYKELFNCEEAIEDITYLEEVFASKITKFRFKPQENDLYSLKVYNLNEQVTISKILPIIQNFGFEVVDNYTFKGEIADNDHPIWYHHYILKPEIHIGELELIQANFEEALHQIWIKHLRSDLLSSLVITKGINPRHIMMLKAICKYLMQIGTKQTVIYITKVLRSNSEITSKLVKLFEYKFCPITNSVEKYHEYRQEILKDLEQVSNVSEDKVFRQYLNIIDAIWRTNFYQTKLDGTYKNYVSFKINSHAVEDLPLPKVYAENFVYATFMEAIHLRGGKVARGGLRWSDRLDDFRTEVLGLVKAQMTKNSIIVPVGSKGGFVVKGQKVGASRETQLEQGIECYSTFLRGVLDITDNIVDSKIIPPLNVIRHDGDDPYLVVAADKGTATFSDIANSISKEYNFWLADAFASGGSQGYDHKKMGITARGGWVAVERHFEEMGIDIKTQSFTVAGIGGMSGDVFGNGMLLSDNIKLVAAFNHSQIFCDPHPDPKKSYEERKRLFGIPYSSWEDYDKNLISKGGRVFNRDAKSLNLTPEIKELLGINQDSVTPDELIRAILKAPVDLIWNGGIGTYVKSKEELNEQVGDKANDNLRVNGEEFRCKIIGEGGNLGCTQRGRIEYALNGGRINTDAIDNSAGVDCSDHEVNIKIAFNIIQKAGSITIAERNKLLEQMTKEVAALVLEDNKVQTLALSLEQFLGGQLLNQHSVLIDLLEQEGILNRLIEFLPSGHEIEGRKSAEFGLTRPEIAIILAYSKLSLYNKMLASVVPDNERFNNYLLNYFPQMMVKKFESFLLHHPLKREIIATVVINKMINRLGTYFCHLTLDELGVDVKDLTYGYELMRLLTNFEGVWEKLDQLPIKEHMHEAKMQSMNMVRTSIQKICLWLTRNIKTLDNFDEVAKEFETYYGQLTALISNSKLGLHEEYKQTLESMHNLGLDEKLAKQVAALYVTSENLDIIKFASSNNISIHKAAKIFESIDKRLQLGWFKSLAKNIKNLSSYWQRVAQKNLINELDELKNRLAQEIIKIEQHSPKEDSGFDAWLFNNMRAIEIYDQFLNQIHRDHSIELATITVVINRVKFIFDI
ncbi:NAD-glutamate dehydrogenase [Rickettsiales endosymbiont of Stachyamoeba lipophora]|uniref:NAD-glutamate dehydrogenase n=1 Tax=Rickettsiales endosymbiont of Stachyamoeba lipophora TaxID=2486578 RepID=UPI000F64D56E|nr:NAD-glutamate dehydrogenase domain-containing protein [Rickettsiales endosymbiont of Stachyamoeba lipophora]AZL15419.1 hypothetical protein EF513_02470 [Rickettsiales endosymbiont of Stachyamoeba lipophora]